MTQASVQIRLQNNTATGLGKVSAAASVEWNVGVRDKRSRKLGCYGLVYVTRGGGVYSDADGRRRNIRTGDLIRLFPDIAHAYGPARGQRWDEIYVLFEGPVFDLWRQARCLDASDPVIHLNPVSTWRNRLERIWANAPSPLVAVCRLQTFLADVEQTVSSTEHDESAAWMQSARHLLEQDLQHPVDLHNIAHQLGMSYESFRKTFRRMEGTAPGLYRRRKIMDDAARRLLQFDLPLKQIAEDAGFCDEFYFSRQFKKVMGVSPGAYRRRIRR